MTFTQFKEKNGHLNLSEHELYNQFQLYQLDLDFQEWTRRKILEKAANARGIHASTSTVSIAGTSGSAGASGGGSLMSTNTYCYPTYCVNGYVA